MHSATPTPTPSADLTRACLVAGAASAVLMAGVTMYCRRWGWQITDFDQLWVAGRALVARQDPYTAWHAAGLAYPLYYPLHAVVLTLPLALVPLELARTLLSAVTGFVAGYGLRRLGWWSHLAILSPAWWGAALQGQTAPALAGAAMVPSLGFVLAVKPTVGLALWLSRPNRQAVVGVLVLTLLCFLIWPPWFGAWWSTIQDARHIRAPITRPGGILLLLALLRWRTPEGRLLAAWALIPRTESLYDMLPLFLVANSAASAGLLVLCTLLALVGLAFMPAPVVDLAVRTTVNWPVTFGLIYLPTLLVVLSPLIEIEFRRLRPVHLVRREGEP
ncbi:MAG TPA: hypothetical protein VFM14_10835 [Gemmatimonadales bacterium]|nr:hypothetical protein [Gemmatimonadales bacterium]